MTAQSIGRRQFVQSIGAAAVTLPIGERLRLFQQDDLAGLTLAEAAARIRARRVTPVALVEACLERIREWQPHINAFIMVTSELALEQARTAQAEIARGSYRGPLHGIPIALKDNIDTAGLRTTAGSAVFAERVPTEDAEVVRKLTEAGAILLGKLNMDEFANGGHSVESFWGPVRNPWNLDHEAGGSSGGPAAAVAARLCFGAVGTDTGGSIRSPAGHCGVVGLKPTYGRVSNRGVIPLVWSLDHTGPLARTAEDAALLLQTIAGYDPHDPGSVDAQVPSYAAAVRQPIRQLRVGIPRNALYDVLEPEVSAAVERAIEVIRPLVKDVADVALPPALSARRLGGAEFYAYHKELLEQARPLYQPSTRRDLEGAAKMPAYQYVLLQRQAQEARRQIARVFEKVDVLLAPTVKYAAKTIQYWQERLQSDRPSGPIIWNTGLFNVFGVPAMSVPCGFTAAGLPIGLMIAGPALEDARVLAVGHAYQQATDWHRRSPRLPESARGGGR